MSTEVRKIGTPPLTIAELADRWRITELEAARRVRRFDIPAFNVGTAKEPEWRWRLPTVEAWEAQNERSFVEVDEAPSVPIKPNAPVGWDGKIRLGRPGKVRK